MRSAGGVCLGFGFVIEITLRERGNSENPGKRTPVWACIGLLCVSRVFLEVPYNVFTSSAYFMDVLIEQQNTCSSIPTTVTFKHLARLCNGVIRL